MSAILQGDVSSCRKGIDVVTLMESLHSKRSDITWHSMWWSRLFVQDIGSGLIGEPTPKAMFGRMFLQEMEHFT